MSTLDDPELREQFREQQKQWKFKTYALWRDGLNEIFGGNPPRSATWVDPPAIAEVLDKAVHSTESESGYGGRFVHAYLLLSDSGDSQLHGVDLHSEDGCIVLRDNPFLEGGYVLKPSKLSFESPEGDLHLSYFWLEVGSLEPSGVYSESYYEERHREYLCEVRPGEYIHIDRLEENEWTGDSGEREPLPESACDVMRYLERSSLLICCKSSPYKLARPSNADIQPDNGFHASLGEEEYRSFISDLAKHTERSEDGDVES
jgi:hypothetical protein